jgi:hypothetical protein
MVTVTAKVEDSESRRADALQQEHMPVTHPVWPQLQPAANDSWTIMTFEAETPKSSATDATTAACPAPLAAHEAPLSLDVYTPPMNLAADILSPSVEQATDFQFEDDARCSQLSPSSTEVYRYPEVTAATSVLPSLEEAIEDQA